jgi:predicted DNA-binding transcriptional regulator AlpA
VKQTGDVVVSTFDLDPSLNARAVCNFKGGSLPALNRDIREGRFPQPDYVVGQYRYWKRSTVTRWREQQIVDSADKLAQRRKTQLDAAARARDEQRRKRAARAAAASPSDAA